MIDLSVFDRLVGIDGHPATMELWGSGAIWHILLGGLSMALPAPWSVIAVAAFGAYEFSKVEGGKPFSQVAGAMLEFALGMAAGALIL